MIIKGKASLFVKPKAILLIQLGDIGDVIVSVPCIRALKECFPNAVIVVAVRDKAAGLIRDLPWVDEAISVEKKGRHLIEAIIYQIRFFTHLRNLHLDLAIDLRMGTRGGIMVFLSGASERIGVYDSRGTFRNRFFTHLCLPEVMPGRHMAKHCLGLLEQYGISTEDERPELVVSDECAGRVRQLLAGEGVSEDETLIAVQPFSLWAYKDWGISKYAGLIEWIRSRYGVPVLITGSESEREQSDVICAKTGGRVYNMAGKTSIGELAGLLKCCGLFIGGDSAGLHIAAAVGTPTVGIYGPSSSEAWAPRGEKHCVVSKDMPCMPCSRKGCSDSGISRCMEELSLEEVIADIDGHIEKLLEVKKREISL